MSSNKSIATVNSPLPSTSEVLSLLDQLRTTVQTVARKAEQLDRDLATRTHRVRYHREEALRVAREQYEATRARCEAHARERRLFLERTHHHRQRRILLALENQRQRSLARLEATAGRETFEIQRAQLEADRRRDQELAAAKQTYETFQARLAEARDLLLHHLYQAQLLFSAHPALARALTQSPATLAAPALPVSDPDSFGQTFQTLLQELDHLIRQTRRLALPILFRYCPWWLGLLLGIVLPALALFGLARYSPAALTPAHWTLWAGGLALWLGLYFLSRTLAQPRAHQIARLHAQLAAWLEQSAQLAESNFQTRTASIQNAHAQTIETLNERWRQLRHRTQQQHQELLQRIEAQGQRAQQRNDTLTRARIQQLETDLARQLARIESDFEQQRQSIESAAQQQLQRLQQTHQAGWNEVQHQWHNGVLPLWNQLRTIAAAVQTAFPPWDDPRWAHWTPPADFLHAAPYAHLQVDFPTYCGINPAEKGLPLPQPPQLRLPLLLAIPREGSLLLETHQADTDPALNTLNNLILRLLTSAPPGRLAFTILDPVGLGQNFAGLMHLADYEDRLIHGRIWTQPAHIEERLAELNEHVEKVTQMYLRNEYATLAEYNAQAGRLAEKYHFLVVAHFPVNFTDLAVKRLQSLAASGPRCGVHILLHWDLRRPAPPELVPDELRKSACRLLQRSDRFVLADADHAGLQLELETPPPPETATALLHRIGQSSQDAYRVETPFADAAPAEDQYWSGDATEELRVPIGRTGATKLQYLALGRGTRQHGLIAGKTGSGKSTLFHVLITNLALWYSPDEVEFYLVDFKKGVEFKCYATHRLPHARVIAIESDRDFALSVLQRVDEELRHRGDLFRQRGVQDLPAYRRLAPDQPLPRVLLLIDEFQEFFVEDDRIAQTAALLLDRIVRQGRAFGIHVLLGSQTLGGAYTLARSTMGQMVVRIALQCNEADALLIMSEDNPTPRLLSRPGEAIYNDEGGALQANSPFQVVWLPDHERDQWLRRIRALAETSPQHAHRFADREPIVFEGNAPADIRSNRLLRRLLHAPSPEPTTVPRLWLGEPNAIKGPTEVRFPRQSGSHLLIVGQREETALTLLLLAPIILGAQLPREAAQFYLFDCSPPDAPDTKLFQQIFPRLPHPVRWIQPADTEIVLQELLHEHQRRSETLAPDAPELFLLVHRLQHHKKLRYDEDAAFAQDHQTALTHPGLILDRLITQGANLGFHFLVTCDTYANLLRQLSRKALAEFELRVLFQMSANDSASLIDSPQANNLGLHRALLFHGHEGWIETFRPYALPDPQWFDEALRHLARLHQLPVRTPP